MNELSREDYLRMMDDYARRFLDMSLDEFLRRLDAGEPLPDRFAVAGLMVMTGAAAS